MLSRFFSSPFPVLDLDEAYYLREQHLDDSDNFLKYYSDPFVGQHILATKPSNLMEANIEINYCRNLFHHRKGIYWTLADKKTNSMIGAIGIYINPHHHRGEICYDLDRAYWNKGIMTKALKKVIDFSFKSIGLARLEASTLLANTPSIIVLKKLGFQFEGTLKKYRYFQNKFYDIEMFSLISPTLTNKLPQDAVTQSTT